MDISSYQEYLRKLHNTGLKLDLKRIDAAVQEIRQARKNGNWVYLFGNGGSVANASHWANGLQSVGVRAHVLDSVSIITAIANDEAYSEIFVRQLRDAVRKEDVAIGFSCSGESLNVLKAAQFAARSEATVIGLTAFDGGALRLLADISIHVPVDSYEIGEDVHSIVGHMITLRLKELEC